MILHRGHLIDRWFLHHFCKHFWQKLWLHCKSWGRLNLSRHMPQLSTASNAGSSVSELCDIVLAMTMTWSAKQARYGWMLIKFKTFVDPSRMTRYSITPSLILFYLRLNERFSNFWVTSWYDLDDVIKWKHLLRYWPLCGEFTGHRWIPLTKASDVEFLSFLWLAHV